MKLRVEDIEETGQSVQFREEVGELNKMLAGDALAEFWSEDPAEVSLSYYRYGEDLFFDGHLVVTLAATCARCLENYTLDINRRFTFVLKPVVAETSEAENDNALGFYEGEEVDLAPRLQDEIILELPLRPLCREDCPGLCPGCGRDLRAGVCACSEEQLDPRLAPLRGLKAHH
jgi:uncharacterized protein